MEVDAVLVQTKAAEDVRSPVETEKERTLGESEIRR